MKLEVKVREQHITKGRPKTSGLCPVALALREQHPRANGILWMVGYTGAYQWPGRGYRFPEAVSRWIWEFDLEIEERIKNPKRTAKPIKPITFVLED